MNYSEMEQEIKSLREEMKINAAILAETRRSEERLFRTFLIVPGVVVAIFGALLGYTIKVQGDFVNKMDAARISLENQVGDARRSLDSQRTADLEAQRNEFKTLKTDLWKENDSRLAEFRKDMSKDQSDGYAYTLNYVADIRLSSREVELAIRAALEQFNQATQGRGTYQSYALDKLADALTIGAQDGKCIPEELQSEVQTILERQDTKGEARGIRLKETLKS